MTTPWNLRFGGIHLTAGADGDSAEVPPGTPFRLLISGNFSGQRRNPVPIGQRKPIRIDRDNLDEVLAKMAPSITVPHHASGKDVTISFRALDDFEPDSIFRQVSVFDELRSLQSQLGHPSTFSQAAAKVRAWGSIPKPAPAPTFASGQTASPADILEQIVAETQSRAAPELPGFGDWQSFLARVVQPHLEEKADPRQADYEAIVEQASGAYMRAILHDPRFQALEAAWRSVALLVKRLETDESLQIFVFDAALDEWRADLGQDDPRSSVFYREVVQRAADKPWAAFVSLETFGKDLAGLEVLASMAMLSAAARTPVLAAAAPALAGCPSLTTDPDPRSWKPDPATSAAWQMVRGLPQARYLGLVTPRFLLRLPYGKEGAATESFVFEEMPAAKHEHYLWGTGAVLCALLLAEDFASSGWDMSLHGGEIGGLPVHVYDDGGEPAMKPCAEAYLRESALAALTDAGLMVLVSMPDRDVAALHHFQSAVQGTEPLAGRWQSSP